MSDFFLEPPVEIAPRAEAPVPAASRPATLGGIDWSGIAAEAQGQIALVEVDEGEGQLQEWGKRGNA